MLGAKNVAFKPIYKLMPRRSVTKPALSYKICSLSPNLLAGLQDPHGDFSTFQLVLSDNDGNFGP